MESRPDPCEVQTYSDIATIILESGLLGGTLLDAKPCPPYEPRLGNTCNPLRCTYRWVASTGPTCLTPFLML